MPSRGLGQLEKWACENLMKISKAKCKVLHMGHGNSKHNPKAGWRTG